MNTTLGLTCISEELKQKDKKEYSFRTMTRKRFVHLSETIGKEQTIKINTPIKLIFFELVIKPKIINTMIIINGLNIRGRILFR